MPKLRHEAVVEVLQNEPLLVLLLLAFAGADVDLGTDVKPRIADSNLSERDPDAIQTFLADNVFVFEDGRRKIAVVAEVQTGSPRGRRCLAWPAYVANARSRHACDTYLLVFATRPDAARGSGKAISLGHPGLSLIPLLTGVGRVPRMPPEGWARVAPELIVLSVVTGELDLSTHEARMFALTVIMQAPVPRRIRYARYIRALAPPQARKPLGELMTTVIKDAFMDRLIDQGVVQGSVQKARQLVLRLLEKRLSVPASIRNRVNACTDIAVLDTWFDRAATAESLDEVFALKQEEM